MSFSRWRGRIWRFRTTALPMRRTRRPCCSAASIAFTAPQVLSIRSVTIAAITGSFSIDERGEEITMTRTGPTAEGLRLPRMRAAHIAAVLLVGASLGACKTTETADTVAFPNDYRQRHPIAIREGTQTVELLIGKRRAGLTPNQRAAVAAFAKSWHGDSTGGVLIRVPVGTASE